MGNRHHQRLRCSLCINRYSFSIIKSGNTGDLVRNPPRTSATASDTPWIKQVRIDEFCAPADIGNLIGLLILLSKRRERREGCAGHNEGKASAPHKERDEKTAFRHRY